MRPGESGALSFINSGRYFNNESLEFGEKLPQKVLTNFGACVTLAESNHKDIFVNDEARKSVTMKMKPSIVKRARVRAVMSEKTLGEWIEGAIEEKAAREEEPAK